MTHRAPSTLRCAIYTRKSSEEGLDMAFNSLDAQREACLDFIKSQRHQGWTPLHDKYDDGGFSGGTTDRPGLNRLLSAIEAGRVDIVVVYKVDRLSRSLADFARLMQLFDEHRVSFVSVTQQFSTTSSMGRLTLNMLLSFAQFEREVAGERIRDKIAATMKKGVWVCGQPPLGYRVQRTEAGSTDGTLNDRILRIVPEEARVVRQIYESYLSSGSLLDVARRMNTLGHTTKRWTSTRGKPHGGNTMCSGYIHRVLTNPVYIGKIAHTRRIPGERSCTTQTDVHDGLHEPIIARETWDRVQERMARIERSAAYDAAEGWKHTHLLKGKLKAADGRAMSPAHVTKQRASGVTTRVPYYVSQRAIKQGYAACPLKSINARHVDDLVRSLVLDHAASTDHQWHVDDPSKRDLAIRDLIERVVVTPESLAIELVSERIETLTASRPSTPKRGREKPGQPDAPRPAAPFRPEVSERGRFTVLTLAIQIKKLDGRRMLVGPDGQDLLASHGIDHSRQPNPTLVRALAQAHAWHRELIRSGDALDAFALRIGLSESRVRHLLPLTHLGPAIIRAVLRGEHRERLTLQAVLHAARHLDWSRQTAALRLPS